VVCELYLSNVKAGFPTDKMRQTIQFIKENYGTFFIDCKTYDRLYEYMLHDKKNSSGIINFTLLKEVGDVSINQSATKDEIFEMLDFYRECMGSWWEPEKHQKLKKRAPKVWTLKMKL